MVENRRAPRGDGKTQLIEREGERHPHRLVVTQSGHWPSEFAVMHNRSGGVVGCKLHEELPSGWSVLLLTRSRRAAAGSLLGISPRGWLLDTYLCPEHTRPFDS